MIESVNVHGGNTAVIKSHHNVGGLPETLHMKLVEPLRELFKDEVRAIGRHLGLDARIVARQPFPGPGLAVRIVGEVTRERCDLLRARRPHRHQRDRGGRRAHAAVAVLRRAAAGEVAWA